MSIFLINNLFKRINSKNTNLLIASFTYHSIISLIPTLLLTMLILNYLNIKMIFDLDFLFVHIGNNFWANFLICFFSIYWISKNFFIILKERFSLIKSLIFSFFGSLIIILFLTSFISTYLIDNIAVSNLAKLLTLFMFLFVIITTISSANFKYSFIFSLAFSAVSLLVFHAFFSIAIFFIDYEKYYGILAPIFLIILSIHLFIHIIYFAYIGAEEFTKISNIRFIKM